MRGLSTVLLASALAFGAAGCGVGFLTLILFVRMVIDVYL